MWKGTVQQFLLVVLTVSDIARAADSPARIDRRLTDQERNDVARVVASVPTAPSEEHGVGFLSWDSLMTYPEKERAIYLQRARELIIRLEDESFHEAQRLQTADASDYMGRLLAFVFGPAIADASNPQGNGGGSRTRCEGSQGAANQCRSARGQRPRAGQPCLSGGFLSRYDRRGNCQPVSQACLGRNGEWQTGNACRGSRRGNFSCRPGQQLCNPTLFGGGVGPGENGVRGHCVPSHGNGRQSAGAMCSERVGQPSPGVRVLAGAGRFNFDPSETTSEGAEARLRQIARAGQTVCNGRGRNAASCQACQVINTELRNTVADLNGGNCNSTDYRGGYQRQRQIERQIR